MKLIGFRASPTEVTYAIITANGSRFSLEAVEKIIVPLSLSFPERLNFLRKTVKDILFEYQIKKAGIRITEQTAQKLNIERISIEAILQEVLTSSAIDKYFVGQISTIFCKLGIEKTAFKKLIDDETSIYNELVLTDYNNKQREAILVAIACIQL